jgi:DNA replicative helicase MCM subunit Mcm2 (Cdc46/Mcm family)
MQTRASKFLAFQEVKIQELVSHPKGAKWSKRI